MVGLEDSFPYLVPMPGKATKKKGGAKVTPMMQQYLEVRRSLPPNCLLLFRLGDFYEMFDDDAEEGSRILGLTLTHRNGQRMAGLPYHAADGYIQKVLAAGMKVAIVDQMQTPKPGQIVKRKLTRILTPGTAMEENQIEANRNHFLLALQPLREGLAAAWLDLTSGEFQITQAKHPGNLLPIFASLSPREIILPENAWNEAAQEEDFASFCNDFEAQIEGLPRSTLPDYQFDLNEGLRLVTEALGVLHLEGFGIAREHAGLGPAGALLTYARENLRTQPKNLRRIKEYQPSAALLLDPSTLRNLEIFRDSSGQRKGSLLAAMDGTVTAPGARLLESWLAAPTLEISELQRRQACVGEFLDAPALATEVQAYLQNVRDLPRLLTRLRNRLKNPRELAAVGDTLQQVPFIEQSLEPFDGIQIMALRSRLRDFPELRDKLLSALKEELPNDLTAGGYIQEGYDAELDRLRSLTHDNHQWLSDLQLREQERTNIRNLKVRYNNAFGYFIEVTKSNLERVPEEYIRKQTMTNAERFTTAELKEKEKEILHAEEKAIAREESLFRDLAAEVLAEDEGLEETAMVLAELDLLLGWAKLAREWDYCQPELDASSRLEIEHGRHPVIEQSLRRERLHGLAGTHSFVPNDTRLDAESEQIAILTGPNMAGKSTYIRQVALIVLMAQVGSWVPARKARIGLVDRIFSRVGASDELARGHSTFMVEMSETANILNNATARSLIILDEIGRGTSTYDGLSIAWAVVEHLHGEAEVGPRTLFATHYHELTQIERTLPRIRNYCVAVKEWNDQIIFVRQVIRGAADRSYGIQVARLAGLPSSVLSRARTILEKLEAEDSSHNLLRLNLRKLKTAAESGEDPGQLQLF